MPYPIVHEQEFKKINLLEKGEYELCVFTSCDFSTADLSNFKFIECEFINCNFSSSNIFGSSFQEVRFEDCKMLGIRFDLCDSFGFSVEFINCQLDHSSFYQVKTSNCSYLNCNLKEVDFSEADLSKVNLDNCDLFGAVFNRSNLEKSNFTTAYNYSIDPENNKMKGASFSMPALTGLLDKYQLKISTR